MIQTLSADEQKGLPIVIDINVLRIFMMILEVQNRRFGFIVSNDDLI